jgi:hypothetical protein
MGEGGTHPQYSGFYTPPGRPDEPQDFRWFVNIGDEVALAGDPATCVGIVTAIYLDGLLELSTGDDDVLAADLVLLRRAEA